MNEVWKKLISAFLALVMVFQMVPVTSLAAEHQDEPDDTVNWDMPEPEEPDVVGEVEELRDHTSKQFRLSDGSFAAVNYGIPVHYLDEDNNWVDVDNTLIYTANVGQYMSVNGVEQRGFADTLANGQPVLVSQYEDYSVELTLLPMTYETVRDEQELMAQQDEVSDPVESEPADEATEALESTVPEETTEEPTVSEPELTGEMDSTSETLGTDAEATGESEATEAPTESVEETEETAETEVTEPTPETTIPEETVPETTQAEETVPETTIPEETVAPAAESEETISETTAPVENVPETTVPEETVIPETSEPDLEEIVTETVEPSSVSAIVVNPGEASMFTAREELPLSEQVLPEKMGSYVIYESVFPGIDLMYENYGYQIKETILVNELQDSYSYRFLLNAEGLTAALTEKGSIIMTDALDEVIYEIPAPFMFDALGNTSYAVEYALDEYDGDYILTVTADAEWIEDGERVLPVSIDPTITLKCEYVNNGTLYTTHVVQGDPNLAHNGASEQYIGYGTGYNSNQTTTIKECQIYTHVARLPDIPEGCEMVEATLQYYHYDITGYSYIGDCSTLEIAAYPVTEDNSNGNYKSWIEGLKWNTKPDYDSSTLIDFAVASHSTEGSYIQWDVTKQVEAWYADSATTNRTLALVGYESGSYNGSYCAVAVLKGFGSTNPPALIVKYRSAIGLESYYTAQSQNVGAAGTAYVSDYTGQMVIVKNVASHASVTVPFSLNLVYNSYYRDTRFKEARSTGMYFGNGWKLDAVQTLSTCTGDLSNYMLYIDGDGTYHYFLKSGSVWMDEDGLDLKIASVRIKDSNGTERGDGFEIVSGQDDRLRFYKGLLVQQMDSNGNKIFYIYNGASNASGTAWLPTGSGDKLTKVIQRNDGTSTDIVLATLSYASGYLDTVTDRMGNVTKMTYSSQKLDTVYTTNSNVELAIRNDLKAEYEYSGSDLVQVIDSSSGYKVTYTYAQKRISSILESGSSDGTSWTNRTKILVNGTRDKTTYRAPGPDGTISNSDDILTTYLFDDEGRTINSNTTNVGQTVVYGASTGTYAATTTGSATNNHLMNSASIGTTAENLLANGGFETTSSSGWTLTKDPSSSSNLNMALSQDGHRTGNYALKTWFNGSTSGTIRAYRSVSGLTSGQTYTLSGYVNTTGVTSFGSGAGIYLSVTSGGSGTSDTISYKTASTVDSGWARLSVTFKATSSSATVNVYIKNAVGISSFTFPP